MILRDWLSGLIAPKKEEFPTYIIDRSRVCPTKHDVCAHIRWMIRRDMPEVLEIEDQSFEYPWTEEDFVRCLRQRNCIGMIAEIEEQVVGAMIYELHKSRLHVLNFAVHQNFRRCGVGAAMVKTLQNKLSHQRRNRIFLEVRETNLPAQLFFRAQYFRAISVLRDFYEDAPEDAYLMQYALPPQEEDMASSSGWENYSGSRSAA